MDFEAGFIAWDQTIFSTFAPSFQFQVLYSAQCLNVLYIGFAMT